MILTLKVLVKLNCKFRIEKNVISWKLHKVILSINNQYIKIYKL